MHAAETMQLQTTAKKAIKRAKFIIFFWSNEFFYLLPVWYIKTGKSIIQCTDAAVWKRGKSIQYVKTVTYYHTKSNSE